jgi:hypothetical protein
MVPNLDPGMLCSNFKHGAMEKGHRMNDSKKYEAMKQAPTPLSDHTMTLQISNRGTQITLYSFTLNVGRQQFSLQRPCSSVP